MDLNDETGTEARFEAYTADLASVLGHADRVRPFADYCVGLLSAEGRKSVEPLAAVTAPERTAAQHRSLLHFVAQAQPGEPGQHQALTGAKATGSTSQACLPTALRQRRQSRAAYILLINNIKATACQLHPLRDAYADRRCSRRHGALLSYRRLILLGRPKGRL